MTLDAKTPSPKQVQIQIFAAVQMMHQMPFPERCDPCLIWGQIMQISGAHQWFHDIAPFADGIKKTVLTPCFKICCLWYIPSHFLSHFSFGQMTQIVRRHQQPALCGTHQSQVCHCWCISIFNTNTTNRYKSIHTYVCGSSVVFWNSLISIPCFYPLWCWWHKKIITSRGTTVWFNQTDCPFFLHHCRLDLVFVKRAFQ